MKKQLIFFSILIALFQLNFISALGLSVNPSYLEVNLSVSNSKIVEISNTGSEGIICSLYVDDYYRDYVDFNQNDFTLDSKSKKDVKVSFIKLDSNSGSNFTIYIIAKPINDESNVYAGVKLRVNYDGSKDFIDSKQENENEETKVLSAITGNIIKKIKENSSNLYTPTYVLLSILVFLVLFLFFSVKKRNYAKNSA